MFRLPGRPDGALLYGMSTSLISDHLKSDEKNLKVILNLRASQHPGNAVES